MEEKKSKASTRAKNKYNAKAYDRINIAIKKGSKAKIQGETPMGFVHLTVQKQHHLS